VINPSTQKYWLNEVTQLYLGFSNLIIFIHSTLRLLLIEVICIFYSSLNVRFVVNLFSSQDWYFYTTTNPRKLLLLF